jgi:hypothetical protein
MATKLHLVIPDSHAKPGVPNDRYVWAGRLAVHRKPSVIVDIGDWYDMPSLSSYDKGKKAFEGRRYVNDVRVGKEARAAFNRPISDYNRHAGKRQYRPRKESCLGNHEQRIERVSEISPELEGKISLLDLGHKEYGWNLNPYMEPVVIDGVSYAHCFGSGVMARPVSGEHPAYSLIKTQLTSCVAGHVHTRDFCERTRPDGSSINACVVGCYFGHKEEYARHANNIYWRGLVLLHVYKDGHFDPEYIGYDEVRRLYG